MIKYLKGDLFAYAEAGMFDIVVHGCNCMCTMGSGIAKQVREKYPEAYLADQATEPGAIYKLGHYTKATIVLRNGGPTFSIVNAYTQYEYNRRGESLDRFEYASFEVILKKLAHTYGDKEFGFPLIGMGLAGGTPSRIIGLLEWFSEEVERQGGTVTMVELP